MFAVAKATVGMDVTADELTAYGNELIDGFDMFTTICEVFAEQFKPVVPEKKRNFWQRLKYLFTGK